MSIVELEKELARLKQENAALAAKTARPVQRIVKSNASGGLFVRDPSFVAFSESKGKKYTACANIPAEVARELFRLSADGKPGELLQEVCQFVEKNLAA